MFILRIAIIISGLLYIFVIPVEPLVIKLFFKAIPMILIIIYALKQTPVSKSRAHTLILIGLFLGMIGDITIPWFIVGLSAFLVSHLFYIVGFSFNFRPSRLRASFVIILGVAGFSLGTPLIDSLFQHHQGALVIPVLIYIITILVMAWFAMMTGNISAIVGSILFVFSDAVLAWNMFVEPVAYSTVLVMLPYYSAQFFIANSLATIVHEKMENAT